VGRESRQLGGEVGRTRAPLHAISWSRAYHGGFQPAGFYSTTQGAQIKRRE